ncbi:DNA-binding response OmpR family regulator [Phycicoccus badiiscoriae]|uniref:DNA-binding response OmpR family regulator n=1 Tax=Pedococcus badiiscoriae TaxID=642776 RepID=A0A852WE81_9MICO|nr:response regulator transcription factor [Pedococcus badiiscoriae]NYG07338.1 DNA-binding response OmpR family regulator [Pedococcus badiiscoriae]
MAQETANGVAALVIEDDNVLGHQLTAGLAAQGYRSRWSRTGASGLAEAAAHRPDLVVLDLGLPDQDGIDVARNLRSSHPDLLLIILTARDADMDVVVGLDAGADDYLTKPVSLSVLLARLRAHLRSRPMARPAEPIAHGQLHIDTAARACTLAGAPVTLRPKEFDLLATLAASTGTALSREDLMSQVWDENWYGSTKTLDVTMVALRKKLDAAATAAGSRAPVITTLRGHGYRMELA